MPKDQPLSCKIADDELVIRIGIDTLAFSCERCDDPFWCYNEVVGDFVQQWKVIDNQEWAVDVARELNREGEDGSTSLTRLIDKMFVKAMEHGSLGIWPTEEDFEDDGDEDA